MTSTFKQFKTRTLARPEVKRAYDELAEAFSLIDEVLKARAASGLTQAGGRRWLHPGNSSAKCSTRFGN